MLKGPFPGPFAFSANWISMQAVQPLHFNVRSNRCALDRMQPRLGQPSRRRSRPVPTARELMSLEVPGVGAPRDLEQLVRVKSP